MPQENCLGVIRKNGCALVRDGGQGAPLDKTKSMRQSTETGLFDAKRDFPKHFRYGRSPAAGQHLEFRWLAKQGISGKGVSLRPIVRAQMAKRSNRARDFDESVCIVVSTTKRVIGSYSVRALCLGRRSNDVHKFRFRTQKLESGAVRPLLRLTLEVKGPISAASPSLPAFG